MLRTLLGGLAALCAIYIAYLALLYVNQRAVMFPGAGPRAGQSVPLPVGAERIAIDVSFGRVDAIWMPSGRSPAPALLYLHGNAEYADQNAPLLQPLTAHGVHVLVLEYPGYAGSDGMPSRQSLGETARRAYDWLAQRPDVDAARIVAMGRSIGSGPTLDLTAQRSPAALVLLSPFARLADFALRVGAPGFLLRDRFDNVERIAAYDGPVLLFHGRADEVVPYRHSQTLREVSKDARLVTLDCGHNDCPYFDADFFSEVLGFLHAQRLLE